MEHCIRRWAKTELVRRGVTCRISDDLALLISADDQYNLMSRVNQALSIVEKWTNIHELQLAPQKNVGIKR